jgi:HAD superfamily hydrolase (TIGR01509 family)
MGFFRGIILDVDGTLVDSNDAHARAWVDTLTENGMTVPFERVRPLIGMGSDKLLPAVAGIEKESGLGKRLTTRQNEIFKTRCIPNLKSFPGARALLERMRAEGLRLVVASSAQEEELKALIEIAGATDLIEDKASSGDAKHSKPDPDIVAVALDQLGLPAYTALMLDDTPYDIEAAARSGVCTIALRCGGWNDRDLTGAAAIYADPLDLLAHYEESPLALDAPIADEPPESLTI